MNRDTVQTKNESGGLYRDIRVSVRGLNGFIFVCLLLLLLATVVLTLQGGYTVSFYTNGGTPVDSVRLRYGDDIPFPPVPERTGYRFGGWYIDPDLTMRWNFAEDHVKQETVLYAAWIPEQK
ncbi:MAG: InlB B-repeat-containing protein [Clostridiales bacterium]|nr:InlB B-repeat-containing protein [Clostridiales bacterium]